MMRRRQGFTLIEIIIVLALLTILTVTLYVVFNQAARAWRRSEARLDIYQNARIGFDQMSRELSGAVLYETTANFSFTGEDTDPDEVSFVTPIATDQGDQYQLCRIRYYLANGNLMRYIDRSVTGAGSAAALALNVSDLTLEYWDTATSAWLNSWHSEAGGGEEGRLPAAVRIEMTVQEDVSVDPETKVFRTVVTIPAG